MEEEFRPDPESEPEPEPEPEPEVEALPEHISTTLSPSSSGRRSNNLNSPEFEFWMVRNPSFPQPNLHSADELFVDGVILPLCLLPDPQSETPIPEPEPVLEPEITVPESGPGSDSTSSSVVSTSKRWRDIFRVGDKKTTHNNNNNNREDDRVEKSEKKKDRRSSSNNGTNNTAEININIWPFSRSRSAGNNGNRPKMGTTRKISSAPCSRSNSGGESKSKKLPTSPIRGGGIHLGRSSPVWQVRRGGGNNTGPKNSENVVRNVDNNGVKKEGSDSKGNKSRLGFGGGGGGGGGVGLNLNVQMCMGLRQNSSCRSDENSSTLLVSGGGGGGGGEESSSTAAANGGGNGAVKLFNLRTLFSKKSVLVN